MPVPRPAEIAAATGHRGVEHHALSLARPGLDRPDELVPEHERPVESGVADPSFEEPVPVRPAQPDRRHAHGDLSIVRLRIRLVVEPQVAWGVQTQGLQERWP